MPIFRSYKWDNLTEPERAAVRDCLAVAAGRMAVGAGTVLTATAIIGQLRRGRPPLPPSIRYGTSGFFVVIGAYLGFMSGGPLYSRRILAVPNSKLADDLRILASDWSQRVPDNLQPIDTAQQPPPAPSAPKAADSPTAA